MNYRHLFHAGNFADVVKHLAFVLVLDHLRQKDKGFTVLDAFAGIGLYDFTHPWALRNPEFEDGIMRLFAVQQLPDIYTPYLDCVRAVNTGRALRYYPGSPLIAQQKLRAQDVLIANEKHRDDAEELAYYLGCATNIRVCADDAYMFLRAHLPPDMRRGVVLVDPPYERADEWCVLTAQMREWKKRWATGIYMIWYPIKDSAPIDDLAEAAIALNIPDSHDFRVYVKDTAAPGLTGTGMMVLNAPYQFAENFTHALAALTPILAQDKAAFYSVQTLVASA